MNRDEYVQTLKKKLDEWNGEAAKWERKTRDTHATMKAEAEKQLAALNGRRDEALYQMKLLQNASSDAWRDVMGGAERAWKELQETVERARSHFEKK